MNDSALLVASLFSTENDSQSMISSYISCIYMHNLMTSTSLCNAESASSKQAFKLSTLQATVSISAIFEMIVIHSSRLSATGRKSLHLIRVISACWCWEVACRSWMWASHCHAHVCVYGDLCCAWLDVELQDWSCCSRYDINLSRWKIKALWTFTDAKIYFWAGRIQRLQNLVRVSCSSSVFPESSTVSLSWMVVLNSFNGVLDHEFFRSSNWNVSCR